MSIVEITLIKTSELILLVCLGGICTRFGMIDKHISKGMSSILVNVVTPCLIIHNLQVKNSRENVNGILTVFVLVLVIYFLSAVLVKFIFREKEGYDHKLAGFLAMYGNCGYVGVPLVSGILGEKGAFYVVAVIAAFNLFAFTHGTFLMKSDNEKITPKGLISPALCAVVIGIIFLLTGFKLPGIIGRPMQMMAQLNTPVAMLVSGFTIATTDFKHIVNIKEIIKIAAVKLLLIPAAVSFVLSLVNIDPVIRLVVIITSGCSCATLGVILAVKNDKDSKFAAVSFAFTTLLLVITLPLIMAFTYMLGIKI